MIGNYMETDLSIEEIEDEIKKKCTKQNVANWKMLPKQKRDRNRCPDLTFFLMA